MQVEVVKWGNSHAIRLPAAALKESAIKLGDRLEVKSLAGKLVLEPIRHSYRLEDLVAGLTRDNLHGPIDFSSAGRLKPTADSALPGHESP